MFHFRVDLENLRLKGRIECCRGPPVLMDHFSQIADFFQQISAFVGHMLIHFLTLTLLSMPKFDIVKHAKTADFWAHADTSKS